jgi:hypothetical protein
MLNANFFKSAKNQFKSYQSTMPFSERKYPIIKLASNKFDVVVFRVVLKKEGKFD